MESPSLFDVAVVGPGIAGLAAALGAAQQGLRTALVGPTPSGYRSAVEAAFDARIYAVAPSSVALLDRLKVWPAVDAARVQQVVKMRVFGDEGDELRFDAWQAAIPQLASIVEEGELLRVLGAAAGFAAGLTRIEAPFQSMRDLGDSVHLRLADGREIEARLVVAADGANSAVRAAAGITAHELAYEQTAVVANFGCERPHQSVAWQWFDPSAGVIALLPLPGDHVTLVWSAPQQLAEELLGEAADLPARLAGRAGPAVGRLTQVGGVYGFPLRRLTVDHLIGARLALVGDAAHVVHPLAGQGLNLGLADVSELLRVLGERENWRDPGDAVLLRRYERLRAEPVGLMRLTTHALARLFNRGDAMSRRARNLGLKAIDAMPPLKNALIRHAAGAASKTTNSGG